MKDPSNESPSIWAVTWSFLAQGNMMLAAVVLCTVLALVVAVPSQDGWTRGDFGTLSFAADYKSYQWVYGNSQHTCKERADTDGSI